MKIHKNSLILGIIAFIAAMGCMYISAIGWSVMLTAFVGTSISLWKGFVFSLGFSIIRHVPFTEKQDTKGKSAAEWLGYGIMSLAMDSIAVFWLIPYALGL